MVEAGFYVQIVLFFVLLPCSFVGCCLWNKRARRLAALPVSTSPQLTRHLVCSSSNSRPPKNCAPCARPIAKKCCTIFCGMGGIQPVTSVPFLVLGMVKEISENVFAWINYVDAAQFLPEFQAKGALYVTLASGFLDVIGFIVMLYAIPKYRLKKIKDEDSAALYDVNTATKQSNQEKRKKMGSIQENVMTLEYFSDTLRIFVSGVYFFMKIKSGLKIGDFWTLATVIAQLFLSAVGANSALRKRYGLRFRRTIYQVQPNEADPMCGRWWCFWSCNVFSQSITILCLLSALTFIPSFTLNFSCCSEMPCWVKQEDFHAGICDLASDAAAAVTQCANDPSMLLSMNASSRANYISCGTRFVAGPQCASCKSSWEKNQAMFDLLLETKQERRTLKDTVISKTKPTKQSLNDQVNGDLGCGWLDGFDDTGIVYEANIHINKDGTREAFCCPGGRQQLSASKQCVPYPFQDEFESRPNCICGPGREVTLSDLCGTAEDCAGDCSKCDASCNEVLQKYTCKKNNAFKPFALRTCETAWHGYSSLLACNVQQKTTLTDLAETLVFAAIVLSSYFWAIFPAMSCIYGCCFGCCFCMPHGIEARFNEIKKRGVPERIVVLGPGWFADSAKGLILPPESVETEMIETRIGIGQTTTSPATSVMNPVNLVEKSLVTDDGNVVVRGDGPPVAGGADWIDWTKAIDPDSKRTYYYNSKGETKWE